MVFPQDPSERGQLLLPLTRHINESDLHRLARDFSKTYALLAKTSTEHFLATPVTKLPTGLEKGKFLAIDVGGTNLRVGVVQLLGDSSPKLTRSHEMSWPIGDHMKMDKAEDLFAWIGDCIADVVAAAIQDSGPDTFGEEIPLGITFSFPMTQSSMSEAILMPMGKGFAITSDLNLGRMLLAGYSRHCEQTTCNGHTTTSPSEELTTTRRPSRLPRLRIAAITNDSVATFIASSYLVKSEPNSRTAMGLIVGTGCNATVPMLLGDLHPTKPNAIVLPQDSTPQNTTIVINTEWTIRGTDVPMKDIGIPTVWDVELDKNSEYPGFQPFEYMTAGRYIGELVRLAFVDLASQRSSSSDLPVSILQKNAITTTFLATTVASADDATLQSKLSEMFPPPKTSAFQWSTAAIQLLREIAHAVQIRASALIAAAIVGLLACVKEITIDDALATNGTNGNVEAEEELVVAFTGRTISGYPGYLDTCQKWVDTLVKNGSVKNLSKRVVLKETLDGGILGAAVAAGMTVSG